MTIPEYKAALKNLIDATDDEELLKHWKTHLEREFEQYREQQSRDKETGQSESTPSPSSDNDESEGYSVLESGLGIDE